MEAINPGRNRRLPELLAVVERGATEERAVAVGRLFGMLVPAIPAAVRDAPIEVVEWSQPFVGNGWWREVWRRLGVASVADLAPVGGALARTRGVGRGKLLILVRDLMTLADRPEVAAASGAEKPIEVIRRTLAAIERGTALPQPRLVKELFRAVVAALPAEVRALELKAVPWTSEWCYTTSLWSDLGLTIVADLAGVGPELPRARGIGKWKILTIARELIFLSPELHAEVRPATDLTAEAEERDADPSDSVAAAIDRLAERLSPRDRDVLRRRIGWRYELEPEKLRTLAEAHGVTQERIRQIEAQIRKRIARIFRARNLPAVLRESLRGRSSPADLAALVASGGPELKDLPEIWRPVAALLEAEGGPYLFPAPRNPGRVLVSTAPHHGAGRASSQSQGRSNSAVKPLPPLPPGTALSYPTPAPRPTV